MLAAVLPAAGAPLQLEEIAIPRPRRGEILVRVAACGVCHTDLHVIKGEVAFPTPAVLGHEISGTVVELGDGVDHLEVGARMVGTFIMPCGRCPACLCRPRRSVRARSSRSTGFAGRSTTARRRLFRSDGTPLAMYSMGGLAEYAVLPATAAFAVPAAIPFEEASVLGCAALTAYGAVRHGAELRLGERVAVVGTGGVGSLVVQFAKAHGAMQVVAVDINEEKLEAARRFGATDLVDASVGDAVARVLELTDGGVDVAFEVLGRPETFLNALGMLRDGGRMVAVGIAPIGELAVRRDHAARQARSADRRLVRRAPENRHAAAARTGRAGVLTPDRRRDAALWARARRTTPTRRSTRARSWAGRS